MPCWLSVTNMVLIWENVIKKGIDEIKEQMRGVQIEAHQIENEMEQRFHNLLARKEGTMRNVPASLTQEMESARN